MTDSKEGHMSEFGGRKGKGKWCNYVINSKIKEKRKGRCREFKIRSRSHNIFVSGLINLDIQ